MQKVLSHTQIHIIPFDLGCVFVDVLSVDNSKNLEYAKNFIKTLKLEYEKINEKVEITDNLKLSYTGKTITRYSFINSEIADNAICYIKLDSGLYCYILSSGIGVFVLLDAEGVAIQNANQDLKLKLEKMNIAFVSNYQKKVTQAAILNKHDEYDVLPMYKDKMLQFRKICWDIVYRASVKKEIKLLREYSSNINYKAEGLSYVLTIYVFNGGSDKSVISDNEMKCLMYSPIFSKIREDKSKWDKINDEIEKNRSSLEETTVEEITVDVGPAKIYFSWGGVGVITPEKTTSYSDIINSSTLKTIVRAEIYVQSRWFVADNSMDNVNKSMHCSLENLQRIESLTEFCQAELDNEISANMSTMYKDILKKIVESSKVSNLYKSVISQIRTQRKIKEAHNEDKKSKNRLIANLFLAVFTASSLFKTILDLINNVSNWGNILLFVIMMIIAVGTIIWDYKNK